MRRYFFLLLFCQLSTFALVMPRKVCGRPPIIDNMELGGLQRVYEAGEEVLLSCEAGYVPKAGSRKIVCTASGKWTQPTLKCAPKECSVPAPLKNGEVHFTDIVFLSIVNFTCNEGYVLHGANSSECLHNGTWSQLLPTCEAVKCSLPKIPKNGLITYHRKITGNMTVFGDSVSYECLPPLVLFGNERGHCTANGNWTELPECRYVTCPPPTGITNGFLSFAVIRNHSYKEKVKYGCNVDYFLDGPMEVECEKTGKWSKVPVCRAPCTIGFERGRIFYNGKKLWIEDLMPRRVLHSERLAVYCKNEKEKCGYPVATQCLDGQLPIPECYEEPSKFQYKMSYKSLPSEIKMC